MNALFKTLTLFSLMLLVACGSTLPVKSKTTGGVLAIPKSLETNVSYPDGWKNDIQISDADGNVVGKAVRLHPTNGRQFKFVSNLEPGEYTVSGIRRVGAGETAMGSSRPMKPLDPGIPFTIFEGEVTVLRVNFHVEHKSTSQNRSVSRLLPRPLAGLEILKFKDTMAKANKNNEWVVNWPK